MIYQNLPKMCINGRVYGLTESGARVDGDSAGPDEAGPAFGGRVFVLQQGAEITEGGKVGQDGFLAGAEAAGGGFRGRRTGGKRRSWTLSI
jgi:hypothetical protein